ncbi:TetR/AcrR family transcriptional regulator [Streptomyces sp. NPDC059759]|uniref:TetR/AcrR family transcriptional regulator n=1 Tax=unclassified Streptomyces TaxID=2593676 RepID=UPI003654802D
MSAHASSADRNPGTPEPGTPETGAPRAPRADARRNRDKIIEAARAAFTSATEPVALETVAKQAGVGIATLYRNFPTRDALVEAVFANELDQVAACATRLLEELPPPAALRAWMDRYIAFAATKHAMYRDPRTGPTAGRMPVIPTRERIVEAVETLLLAGARDGSLRADVTPDDLTTLLLGVSLAAVSGIRPEQTARHLDLIADGLRPARHA